MIPERYFTEWSEQAPWVEKHNNMLVFKVHRRIWMRARFT